MFKKIIKATLLVSLLVPTTVFGQTNKSTIDVAQLDKGIIALNYESNNAAKVIIAKGNDKYTYDVKGNATFPLQAGNGEYTISVAEKVEGNKYKVLEKKNVTLQMVDQNQVYLSSTQNINWNTNMSAIQKAKELTKNAKTDKEKVEAVYNYITKNVKYDYAKASSVAAGYIPSIEQTMIDLNGICYDYSSLAASMLRSLGVPTKIVTGYRDGITEYHAWNQVYLEGSGWVIIDTTYDAPSVQAGKKVQMFKNSNEFKVEKEY